MKELSTAQFNKLPIQKKLAYRIIMLGESAHRLKVRKDLVSILNLFATLTRGMPKGTIAFKLSVSGEGWCASATAQAGPHPEKQYEFTGLGNNPLKACLDLLDHVALHYKEEAFVRGTEGKRKHPQNKEFCDHENVEVDVHSPQAQFSDIPIKICVDCGERL